jgi:hypothetical protein
VERSRATTVTGPVLVGALALAAALAVLGVSSALDRTEVAAERLVAEVAGIAAVAGALAAVVDARARPLRSESEGGRLELEDRLRRTLADCDDVDDALAALEQAAAGIAPGRSVAVWRMDESHDRLVPARLATPSGPEPRHLPGLPAECLALRTGSTAITRSSADFDACPHLRPTPDPVSGVCVPLVVDGRRLGVLRWTGEPEHALAADDLATLETLTTLTAWRAAVLDDGSLDVPPVILDPLTGMMNRYSTGLAIRELVRGLVPFSLGVCQLDEAAGYGQHHGAAVGDRAIRLLATTLRPRRPRGPLGPSAWEADGTYRFDRTADPRRGVLHRHPAAHRVGLAARGHVFSYTHTDTIARYQRMRGKRGLLPDGLGRQRPAHRAPGAELLRRALRPVAALRPDFEPPGRARQGRPGPGVAPQLRRAVRAAHRRGREGLRGAVAQRWACRSTGR